MAAPIRQQRRRRLVERVHLMRLQVRDDLRELRDQILDEGPRLRRLLSNKLSFTFLGDLEERVAGHVLDARVQLVHELK